MKILIAGLGSIGRRHLRNLRAMDVGELVLLRSGHSTLPDAELSGFPTERDIGEALQRHQPDAVVISNPTSLHLNVAIPAAEAGCHLFLEKPISHTMADVSTLVEVVNRRDLNVLVGFQFRFHPGLHRIKELLEGGTIGKVVSVDVHWGEYLPAWHPWEDYRSGYAAREDFGGGVLLTLCHPFDYLRWLIGEIEGVSAMTGHRGGLDIEVEDTANVMLRFANGALGSVHLDYIQRPGTHTLKITGQQGCILWDNADGGVQWYQSETETWETERMPTGFERNGLFVEEMKHFIRCIEENTGPCVSLRDGIAALEIVLAAKASAAEGKEIRIGRKTEIPEKPALVVLDFDGVLTDNRVWVTESGEEAVACHRGDGLGLAMLRKVGVEVVVLSTERNPVVAARCKKLNLSCWQGIDDKRSELLRLTEEYGVNLDEVVYIGNDVNDLECMCMVGCGIAVADAHPSVRDAADLILSHRGGHGAVREFCDLIWNSRDA